MERLVLFESRSVWPRFELCQSRCPTSWLKVGFIWFSSSLELAVEEQLPLLSPLRIHLEGVGTVSLVVLM